MTVAIRRDFTYQECNWKSKKGVHFSRSLSPIALRCAGRIAKVEGWREYRVA